MKPQPDHRHGAHPPWPWIVGTLLAIAVTGAAAAPTGQDRAIERSQAALGNRVGDLVFTDTSGRERRLSEFRGRPVVLSLIFTACTHSCSVTTRYIDRVVRITRDALGDDSFTLLTIGFDVPVDTPEAMRAYAERHGVRDPDWHFLSSDDEAAMARLMDEVGFHHEPSPRGFDHTVQLTLLDRSGTVYRQVYGEYFPTPQLVEPLKQLVLGRPAPDAGLLERVGDRVRLFCTVYDARADRYYFDYSLFTGLFLGAVVLGGTMIWLGTEIRSSRRNRSS
jgi:protein SCO1